MACSPGRFTIFMIHSCSPNGSPIRQARQVVWWVLFAPAIFAFVVGGGFWGYCASKTTSIGGTAEKFKVYTWAILPVASVIFVGVVFSQMPDNRKAELMDGIDLSPLPVFLSVLGGLVLSAISIFMMKHAPELPPEESISFLSSEYRELPGVAGVGARRADRGGIRFPRLWRTNA